MGMDLLGAVCRATGHKNIFLAKTEFINPLTAELKKIACFKFIQKTVQVSMQENVFVGSALKNVCAYVLFSK
jgi:hypothetical protein